MWITSPLNEQRHDDDSDDDEDDEYKKQNKRQRQYFAWWAKDWKGGEAERQATRRSRDTM